MESAAVKCSTKIRSKFKEAEIYLETQLCLLGSCMISKCPSGKPNALTLI